MLKEVCKNKWIAVTRAIINILAPMETGVCSCHVFICFRHKIHHTFTTINSDFQAASHILNKILVNIVEVSFNEQYFIFHEAVDMCLQTNYLITLSLGVDMSVSQTLLLLQREL